MMTEADKATMKIDNSITAAGISITEQMLQTRIIAIFRGFTGEAADLAGEALVTGGVRFMEVTMNTEGAAKIIHRWRERFDGRAYIGAGTVTDLDEAREAFACGAQFFISPNLDEEVISFAAERGVDVWPGVLTPTEIVRAWKAGAKAIKLFPIGTLGPDYIREIRGPLQHIPIIATGGVDMNNVADYLKAGASAFGLGSKLVRTDYIQEGQFEQLAQHAQRFVLTVQEKALENG
ncbi:bifunctional 4-hydroxy-2-oxoglutarate aldolase/2-dehydro-3-deoxy-phosphogluconate aldolase [Paenibacillus profundus]|uniref:Bifunctional 4-hydroxy-2-oxoglutarate aldolase/2-dehydro-3-deoxy-phosphogluconate aldolase n=1 Tax=Paenibacillus profundus TaxID=1173085 RepID=A0ABS8YFX7_9BACL|nr:bifunctional 4-hydroxy-2-oxoglutarate aldolase/2-dehydro-3-deoxy-phosphogluconate aldolase [Paenibacillus profundus]MCE5168997.1 bifunctional 4-hydroxy-2-oxoglutarate aldolase/2-dehydro-3-deoxy-phosphogluconate aldolase [Paenibacillus profundus]